MNYNRTELEAKLLAAIIHRPQLMATVAHHIVAELWNSPRAFQDSRLKVVSDAAWLCWTNGRDTTAVNIRRASGPLAEMAAESVQWLLSTVPPESESTIDRLAKDLSQLIRRDNLLDLLKQSTEMLLACGEPQEQISEVQRLIASAPGSQLNIVGVQDAAKTIMEEYSDRKQGKGRALGIPTGYPQIDSTIGGLPVAAMTILGARPSQGKTAIASCISLSALRNGNPVVFFSHEMTANDILQRMACQDAGLSFTHLRSGRLSAAGEAKLTAAIERLKRSELYIIDSGGPTPQDCRNAAMYLINKAKSPKPPLIVVDYIQLEHTKNLRQNRAEELADISSTWIETAKATGAAILMLAQLNRQADGSQPIMSQLRESGALEQDANVVMLLWRPAKDRKQTDNSTPNPLHRSQSGYNWAVLSVAKSRNSDLTEQELYWEGYCMRYRAWQPYDIHKTREQARQDEYNKILQDIISSQPSAESTIYDNEEGTP